MQKVLDAIRDVISKIQQQTGMKIQFVVDFENSIVSTVTEQIEEDCYIKEKRLKDYLLFRLRRYQIILEMAAVNFDENDFERLNKLNSELLNNCKGCYSITLHVDLTF